MNYFEDIGLAVNQRWTVSNLLTFLYKNYDKTNAFASVGGAKFFQTFNLDDD